MSRCPECHSKNVTVEQIKTKIDSESNSDLVLRSWLQPGGVLKNRDRFRTETVCKCEDCGHSWKSRSKTETGMAIFGAVILICVIILEIVRNI